MDVRKYKKGKWYTHPITNEQARYVGKSPAGNTWWVYQDRYTDERFQVSTTNLGRHWKKHKLEIQNCELKEANEFMVHHRHNKKVQGHRFSIKAVNSKGNTVGVVVIGRPVSRKLQQANPRLVEVTRLCTDGSINACSLLYSAAVKAATVLGYTKIQTYTLTSENGASLRASGFEVEFIQQKAGGNFDSPSRKRTTKQKADKTPKIRWAKNLKN